MALLAVKVTLVPAHILPEVAVMVGLGCTVRLNTALLVQLPADPMTETVVIFCTDVLLGVSVMAGLFKLGLAE